MIKEFRQLLILALIVWFVLSVLRTGFNFSKIFTEEIFILNLSDDDKKKLQFGDLHRFYGFIERNIPNNSSSIFLAPGGQSYFLARYYLYPRRLYYAKSPREVDKLLGENKFDYLIVYQTNDSNLDEQNSIFWDYEYTNLVATYLEKQDSIYKGSIFKLGQNE